MHSAACVYSMARSEISLLSGLAEEYRDKCKENPIERWDDLLKVCNCAIVTYLWRLNRVFWKLGKSKAVRREKSELHLDYTHNFC